MLFSRRSLSPAVMLLAGFLVSSAVVFAQRGDYRSLAHHLKPGPHLFIDDELIAEQSRLLRTVNNPTRTGEPIVTGRSGGDDCFQPYVTVLRDSASGLFRLMNFGISVVDLGSSFTPADRRYVFASYNDDGMVIATSPDGIDWKALSQAPVLKHNHDINSLHWDPIRSRFMAIVSCMITDDQWSGERRIPHESVSDDLLHWKEPWPILYPKIGVPLEKGETEFYSMSGVIARGDLLIGLVKILRDDLNATPGKDAKAMGDSARKAAGLGYSVLAWSRDGATWQRDYQPFIPNNPVPGSWDHAMAWGDDRLVVEDTTYIYYGGYKRGHKVARFAERQIGLALLPRDRYVSRDADRNEGLLLTKPLLLEGTSMTINANIRGRLLIRLLDIDKKPMKDFGEVLLRGDRVDHPVRWKKPLSSLKGTPVRIEVRMVQAQLFGFDLK